MSTPDEDLAKLIGSNQELQRMVDKLNASIRLLCDIIVDQEAHIQSLGLRYAFLVRQQADDDE